MRKSIAIALGSATVMGILIAPTAAFAGTHVARESHHASAGDARAGFDPDTAVTFTVNSGELTMTAPTAADLGSGTGSQTGLPGTSISGNLGTVTVTDDRAALDAVWTATASATSFTTGTATTAETIPATDLDYAPGTITVISGTVTTDGLPITMSNAAQPVVDATNIEGDNQVSWNPLITVHIPANAVTGEYSGTISESVS